MKQEEIEMAQKLKAGMTHSRGEAKIWVKARAASPARQVNLREKDAITLHRNNS